MKSNLDEALLPRLLKDLNEDWERVSEKWQDENRDHFDEKFIAPLPPLFRQAGHALQEMSKLMRRIHKVCQD